MKYDSVNLNIPFVKYYINTSNPQIILRKSLTFFKLKTLHTQVISFLSDEINVIFEKVLQVNYLLLN